MWSTATARSLGRSRSNKIYPSELDSLNYPIETPAIHSTDSLLVSELLLLSGALSFMFFKKLTSYIAKLSTTDASSIVGL